MSSIREKNLREVSKFTKTPRNWKEFTVEEACNIGRGRVISQIEVEENAGIYPVYSSQTRNSGIMGYIATFDFDGEYVTWTTDGENAGTVFHRKGKFNCTNVCGTLQNKNDLIDLRYFHYLLGTVAKSYVSYIGNPKLMNGVMANIGLISPPLPQQKKIAVILNTVDKLIEQTQALIDKHTAIKQGMMADLFTRGIDLSGTPETNNNYGQLRPSVEQAPELYKETELGWVPKEWEVKPCKDVTRRICVGIVIQPSKYYVSEGVPALRSANIREDGIKAVGLVHISKESNELLFKSKVKIGDVLTVRTGYPGTSAVVSKEFDGVNCVDIIITSPDDEMLPEYLCDWINSPFGKGQVLKAQGGVAQQHFNVGEMQILKVAVPSKHEQDRIVVRLKSLRQKIKY